MLKLISISIKKVPSNPKNWRNLNNIFILIPPLAEQEEIAEYLDKKCAEIERIIADKKLQIDTLEEYKKSLIYEYVTGKKEVM